MWWRQWSGEFGMKDSSISESRKWTWIQFRKADRLVCKVVACLMHRNRPEWVSLTSKLGLKYIYSWICWSRIFYTEKANLVYAQWPHIQKAYFCLEAEIWFLTRSFNTNNWDITLILLGYPFNEIGPVTDHVWITSIYVHFYKDHPLTSSYLQTKKRISNKNTFYSYDLY